MYFMQSLLTGRQYPFYPQIVLIYSYLLILKICAYLLLPPKGMNIIVLNLLLTKVF